MRLLARTLLAAALMFVPSGPPPAVATPAIAWRTCPEDSGVKCGETYVPADWSKPSGPKTMLTIARRPATDQAHRIGALFVNPGGPGGSAVNMVLSASSFFTAALLARFDLIGMDPRGVGRSSPVLCSQDLVDAQPSPLIGTQAEYDAMVAYNRRLAADCASRSGPVFTHMDTISVARDMDTVRAALGEKQISFYGASYGSLIGEQYSQLFPARLRALALDSVMDHSASLDAFLTQETDAAQDSFDQFVAWCARDTRCAVRGQNIPAMWVKLMAGAQAGTLTNPYDKPRKMRLYDLVEAAFAAFYDPQWYSFSYYLRDATGQPAAKASVPPVQITDHSFPAVFCADWRFPITGFADYRARLAALRLRAPQMLASPLAATAVAGCLGWPTLPANPQVALVPRMTNPVLLVNGVHDPATSYQWARSVAAQIKGTLLTYDGWGHVDYNRSTCLSGKVDQYLLTLVTPPPNTHCAAVEPQPFGVG